MKIVATKDYQEMSIRAAQIIAAQIIQKPDSVLGLATGSTPEGLYSELVRFNELGYIDFSKIKTVNLDEYKSITADNDQSYAYFMNKHLFEAANIKKENTHLPNGVANDGEAECERYEKLIGELGGIDIQLLGIGNNGHIGFNEPSDSFSVATNCVKLTQSTIDANKRFFENEEDVPAYAYTMGIGSIMKARKIILVANGEKKAEILHQALCGKVTPLVPASILQLHPDVTVVADEEAMKLF